MAPGTGPAAANGNGSNGATTKKGCPPPITGSLLAELKRGGAGGAGGANAGASSSGSHKAAGTSNIDAPTGLVPAQFEVGGLHCFGMDDE